MDNTQKQDLMANNIWLNYFNSFLYENKIITESEKNKMSNLFSINSNKNIKPTDLTN